MFKKIYIEITNVCNLKCKFCPESNRKKEFMTVENFKKIIEKTHKHTNLVCLHVKGEPLLHEDLREILHILEQYNLKTNITTNGTLIKQNVEILKNSKAVRQINFSIHSITQNSILNKKYLHTIFKVVDELDNIIISYRLWNIEDIKENNINKEIIEELENYYKISSLTEKLKQNKFLKLRDNIFINQDIEFKWPDIKGDKIIERGRCLALKEQIAILVDGTVVPCCLDNDGNINLGNIFEENFEDILSKEKTVKIKDDFANGKVTEKLCETCGFLKKLEQMRKSTTMLDKGKIQIYNTNIK